MLPHIRTYCDLLTSKVTSNVSKLADGISFDIMGDLCFGRSFGMLTTVEESPVKIGIFKAATRSYIVSPGSAVTLVSELI